MGELVVCVGEESARAGDDRAVCVGDGDNERERAAFEIERERERKKSDNEGRKEGGKLIEKIRRKGS